MFALSVLVLVGCEPGEGAVRDSGRCTDVFLEDADGDGHGGATNWTIACDAPPGFTATDDDCDDRDAAIFPGASETCNGRDDDCDGESDDGVRVDWYADGDGDGFGDGTRIVSRCEMPDGYAAVAGDCDDRNGDVHPDAAETCNGIDDDCDVLVDELDPDLTGTSTWYADADNDGYGDPDAVSTSCRQPDGTVADATDCNDASVSVHVGGVEVCDEIDDDCDGLVDDDDDVVVDQHRYYADADGDGYGDRLSFTTACVLPAGYTSDQADCDDGDSAVGGPVFWYDDGDGDGFGENAWLRCRPDPGEVPVGGDCDSANATVYPGAPEVCDGLDNNCDRTTDEADPLLVDGTTFGRDLDGDGYGDDADTIEACEIVDGYVVAGGDCDDADAEVRPGATEWCDAIDNDCSGAADEMVVYVDWFADDDGDGFGDAEDVTNACIQPGGYLLDATDCDDSAAAISPAADDVCLDEVDNDCDDAVDNCVISLEDADAVIEGSAPSDLVGYGVATGDLDVDGNADLAVSTNEGWGNARVVYGPVTGRIDLGGAIEVSVSGDSFSYRLQAGDADGDGAIDLVAVNEGSSSAYLFLGPVTGDRSTPDAELWSAYTLGSTLSDVAVIGDFDCDAAPDIAVGSSYNATAAPNGFVYVVGGPTTGVISLPTESDYVIAGSDAGDRFGNVVGAPGDVDGDGVADLAAQSIYAGNGGVLYIVDGGEIPGSYDVTDVAAAVISVDVSNASFGQAFEIADYDGDDIPDLIAAASGVVGSSGSRGVVYLFPGPLEDTMGLDAAHVTWESPADDPGQFGTALAVGDIDDDKVTDVLFGAPGSDSRSGAVYVQLGTASGVVSVSTLPSLRVAADAAAFGSSITEVAGWGTGPARVAIGATGVGDRAGAVYLTSWDSLF